MKKRSNSYAASVRFMLGPQGSPSKRLGGPESGATLGQLGKAFATKIVPKTKDHPSCSRCRLGWHDWCRGADKCGCKCHRVRQVVEKEDRSLERDLHLFNETRRLRAELGRPTKGPKFRIYWKRDDNRKAARPTPISAKTRAEAKEKFHKLWPTTKIIKIVKS